METLSTVILILEIILCNFFFKKKRLFQSIKVIDLLQTSTQNYLGDLDHVDLTHSFFLLSLTEPDVNCSKKSKYFIAYNIRGGN